MMRLNLCGVFVLCATLDLHAEDWPQGSGPAGSYIAEGSAAAEWSVVHGKNIAWSKALPETGQSTVVIKDGRLFYTCYQPLEADGELGSNIVAYLSLIHI